MSYLSLKYYAAYQMKRIASSQRPNNHGSCLMHAHEMHPVAFDFFQKFARFEYALKATGTALYLHVDNNGKVSANWDVFAGTDKIRALLKLIKDDETMRIIMDDPPKKRIESGGQLDWSQTPPRPKDMKEVCVMLRRIRNNLFHGDKGNVGTERQQNLLTAGIAILDLMLATDDVVAQRFAAP